MESDNRDLICQAKEFASDSLSYFKIFRKGDKTMLRFVILEIYRKQSFSGKVEDPDTFRRLFH